MNQQQLDSAQAKLTSLWAGEKLATALLNLREQETASRLMAEFDVTIAALPQQAIPLGIQAAASSRTPLVDLGCPLDGELADLKQQVYAAGLLVVLGCGVQRNYSSGFVLSRRSLVPASHCPLTTSML